MGFDPSEWLCKGEVMGKLHREDKQVQAEKELPGRGQCQHEMVLRLAELCKKEEGGQGPFHFPFQYAHPEGTSPFLTGFDPSITCFSCVISGGPASFLSPFYRYMKE